MRSLQVAALLLAVFANADATCEKDYDLLGCYQERKPQNLLFNNRHAINWNDIVGYMNGLACECAKQAKAGGYAGFALHYYGECYGRTNAEIQNIQTNGGHQQHLCVGDQKYDKCDTSAHDHCTGGNYAEGVYAFKAAADPAVNGGFSNWQRWTECDKECGTGLQHRERNCDSPKPSGSGKDCSELGVYSESKACKKKDCPIDGGFGIWDAYGACSKECGGGVQTRTRPCNNPEPAFGGKSCAGLATESRSCNTQPCKVNGGWSSYGSYGVCSKKCGTGTKTKTRTCTNPVPQHGGAGCTGSSSFSTNCNTEGCPDLISCTTKYTSWNKHDGGNMVYADRHKPDCGTGKVMSYYRLERSGKNMRYRYKCCQFKGNVYTMQQKYTSFNNDGNGKMYYLDRHTANCGSYGFISSIRIERNSGHDKVRYNYKCATLNVSKWQSKMSCTSKYTAFNDDGNGKVYYLDRHTLSCSSGYGLNYLKLQRDSGHDNVRYYYKCCKVVY